MTYKVKYIPQAVYKNRPKSMNGCKPKSENWCSEERIIERDIYYGWLKHKAQAKHRGESYSLTHEEWAELWTTENWLRRGRGKEDLCLMQLSPRLGWHIGNVEVVTRQTYLERGAEYRNK